MVSSLVAILRRYWSISREFSQPYLWAQVAVLVVYFSSGIGNLLVLDFSQLPGGMLIQLGKGMVDAVVFVALSHFVLRGYLKDQVAQHSLNFRRGAILTGLIFISALLSVFLHVNLGELALLDNGQPESMTFTIGDKEHNVVFSSPFVMSVVVVNQFLYFALWCLAYIFWQATQSKRELKRQMQQVQIQQLTNQLNPHFLFNTFNSIRALIFEDKDKAAELVTQLSELFRTHLQAHLQPTASLEEEWTIAQQYLDIEKVRLEERLTLSVDIADDVLNQKLPTLTLLTLVENAVKHGIAPNSAQGVITLLAYKLSAQRWRLELTNSRGHGPGMEGTKTGLSNTVKRLELMFADTASLEHESSDKEYRVIIELPYV